MTYILTHVYGWHLRAVASREGLEGGIPLRQRLPPLHHLPLQHVPPVVPVCMYACVYEIQTFMRAGAGIHVCWRINVSRMYACMKHRRSCGQAYEGRTWSTSGGYLCPGGRGSRRAAAAGCGAHCRRRRRAPPASSSIPPPGCPPPGCVRMRVYT